MQSAAVALITVGGSAVAAWCVANDVIWHLAMAEETLISALSVLYRLCHLYEPDTDTGVPC